MPTPRSESFSLLARRCRRLRFRQHAAGRELFTRFASSAGAPLPPVTVLAS